METCNERSAGTFVPATVAVVIALVAPVAFPMSAGAQASGVVDRVEGQEGFSVAWHLAVDEGSVFGVRAYGEGDGNRTSAYAWMAHLYRASPGDTDAAREDPLWAGARTVAFSSTQTRVHATTERHPDASVHALPEAPSQVPFLTRPEGFGVATWWTAEVPQEFVFVALGDAEGFWHGAFDVLGGPGVEILSRTTGPARLATEADFHAERSLVVDAPFNTLRYRSVQDGTLDVHATSDLYAQYAVIGDARDDGLTLGYEGPSTSDAGARSYDLWAHPPGDYTFTLDWPPTASSEPACAFEQAARASTGLGVPYRTCGDWTVALLTGDVTDPRDPASSARPS